MAEKKLNLWQKLLEVKKQVPYLKKDKQGFQYKYSTPEQVLGTINPLLNDHGVFVKTEVLSEQVKWERVTYDTRNGKKTETLYNVPLRFTFINVDAPEEREVVEWFGSGINGEEKGYGSALTYGERYGFLKFFNIATGEDDPDRFQDRYNESPSAALDTAQPTPKPPQQKPTSKAAAPPPANGGVTADITDVFLADVESLFIDSQEVVPVLIKEKRSKEEYVTVIHHIGRWLVKDDVKRLEGYYNYVTHSTAADRLAAENLKAAEIKSAFEMAIIQLKNHITQLKVTKVKEMV